MLATMVGGYFRKKSENDAFSAHPKNNGRRLHVRHLFALPRFSNSSLTPARNGWRWLLVMPWLFFSTKPPRCLRRAKKLPRPLLLPADFVNSRAKENVAGKAMPGVVVAISRSAARSLPPTDLRYAGYIWPSCSSFHGRGFGPAPPGRCRCRPRYWWAIVCRSRWGCSLMPMMAEYLSHNARTPRSVNGPRSPMKIWPIGTGGRESR